MDKKLEKFIKKVPKAEIHLHLEGCIQLDTLWRLYKKNKIEIEGVSSKKDLAKLYDLKSLDQFIYFFMNVLQKCVSKIEDLKYYFLDLEAYLKRNNIRHVELFFSPSKLVQGGMSYEKIADCLQKGSETLRKKGVESLFLIDVSRSFGTENAMKNLDSMLAFPRPAIVGIGLGGAEKIGPATDFEKVFDKARANNLRCVAHAGEDVGSESIWAAIDLLRVERIGHGTSAMEDEKLRKVLKERRIPLEVCVTSNIFTGRFVAKPSEHPVRMFHEEGLLVTLNSDDPTLFGSELCDEYQILIEECGLKVSDMLQVMKNTVEQSFMKQSEKKSLIYDIEKTARKYKIR